MLWTYKQIPSHVARIEIEEINMKRYQRKQRFGINVRPNNLELERGREAIALPVLISWTVRLMYCLHSNKSPHLNAILNNPLNEGTHRWLWTLARTTFSALWHFQSMWGTSSYVVLGHYCTLFQILCFLELSLYSCETVVWHVPHHMGEQLTEWCQYFVWIVWFDPRHNHTTTSLNHNQNC